MTLCSSSQATLLIVDDEPFNLEIIEKYLEDDGYALQTAEDGQEAWKMLAATPEDFDAVLLDRMMPCMNGLEVLARIKTHEILKRIPVIIQTARAARDDVIEGLKAGAFYYLTKPFEGDMLRSIVCSAIEERQQRIGLQREIESNVSTFGLMHSGRFYFRTLGEARNLATVLANTCSDPARVVTGLSELMINAVEHGNLGISYQDKSELNKKGLWQAEIERRLALTENKEKYVQVEYIRKNDKVSVAIKDVGQGFDWEPYLTIGPERAFDSHGRGIAMSRMLSFDRLEYHGKGNEVFVTINLDTRDYTHRG